MLYQEVSVLGQDVRPFFIFPIEPSGPREELSHLSIPINDLPSCLDLENVRNAVVQFHTTRQTDFCFKSKGVRGPMFVFLICFAVTELPTSSAGRKEKLR